MKRWSKEQVEYLAEIYNGKSNSAIAELINTKFDTNYTALAVKSKKEKLNLVSTYKYSSKYSIEVIEYVKKYHKGKSTIELSKEVNELFNLNSTSHSIQNLKSRIKRKEGFIFEPAINEGRIKKGSIPKNKGKKWDEYLSKEKQERCRATTYKKGNKPSNAVSVGTEMIKRSGSNKDDLGYVYVKVCDGKKQHNWVPKQRIIYEQHYGKIPKGYKVLFADGNRFNFDIDNLILVSDAEELIINKKGLRFDNPELTKAGSSIAKIIRKTNELKKKK